MIDTNKINFQTKKQNEHDIEEDDNKQKD